MDGLLGPAGRPPARETVLDEELAGEREDEGQDRHRDRASDSVGGNHHRHVVGAARREVHVVVADAVPWAMSTVIGFYVLSRAMAALQLMAHEPLVGSASAAHRFIRAFVDALSSMLPELDRFTESEWLIHSAGTLADLGFAAMQTVIYVTLLCAAALFDLYRKAL